MSSKKLRIGYSFIFMLKANIKSRDGYTMGLESDNWKHFFQILLQSIVDILI